VYLLCLAAQVDHFSFTSNATFRLRYLQNATHWLKHKAQPIFFYTGNEGDIEMFAQNTVTAWFYFLLWGEYCGTVVLFSVTLGAYRYRRSIFRHAGGISV
jgi:hypothetical protein